MLILDLWGMSFHAVVVFGLGKDLLFQSVLGHCEFLECCSDFIFLVTVFYVSTRQFFSFLTSFYQCFLGKPIYAMYRHVGVTGQVALNEYLKQVSNLKWSVKLCFGKVHFDASIHRSGRVRDFQNGVSKIFRLRYLFILHRFFLCVALHI